MAELDRDIALCSKTALQTFVYDYSWEHTISAYMLRFPKHPLLPVLLDSEVISDSVDSETKIRTIVRNCSIDIEAPTMFKRAIGVNHLIFTQTTTINPAKRLMKIINFNETFKDKAVFGDDCEFRVLAGDSNKTEFIQYGFFRLPKLPLAKTCEKIMCKSYEKHSAEGRHIDIALVQESITSGIWKELAPLGSESVYKMKVEHAAPLRPTKRAPKSRDGSKRDFGSKENSGPSRLPDHTLIVADEDNSLLDETQNQPFLTELGFGLVVISLAPVALRISHPLMVSLMTTLVLVGFLAWHMMRHAEAWIDAISVVAGVDIEHPSSKQKDPAIKIEKTVETRNVEPIVQESNVATPSKSPSPYTVPLPLLKKDSQLLPDHDDHEEDSESSDAEAIAAQAPEEEEEDEEIDEEELRDMEDDDADDSLFLVNVAHDEESSEFHNFKLRDIQVRLPAYIDKSCTENGLIHFLMEVTLPNGNKRTVERLYTDFVRLRKHFAKTIPQCKVQLGETYLPKKKTDSCILGMAIDQRRISLQNYISGLLLDEAVAKLAHRALIEFLRRPGPLFVSTSLSQTAKKKLFGTSMTSASLEVSASNSKSAILYYVPWKSCLKELRVIIEKNNGVILLCPRLSNKDADAVISFDEIEAINSSVQGESPNFVAPFGSDRLGFLEIVTSSNDGYVICGPKEQIAEWTNELKSIKTQGSSNSLGKKMNVRDRSKRKSVDFMTSSGSDNSIVMNRKRLHLTAPEKVPHPCDLAIRLINEILTVFQEYTDSKCVITSRVTKMLQKFGEMTGELQVVDLNLLSNHSEKISFFTNVFHTLTIHAHLELGFASSLASAKRIRGLFKVISYDISNYIFSLHDIEHSVLRAKMSRSLMNTSFSLISRFKKNDPRNKWVLSKPDLRINFILNSGTKSSVYNIWVYSRDPDTLNMQLDHTATHFLNEQVSIDYGRSIIYLPRICQYYKGDLGGSKRKVLRTLWEYMSVQMEREVKNMIKNEKTGKTKIKIRYTDYDWSMRGVFFKGHDVFGEQMDSCQLKPKPTHSSEENLADNHR